MAPNPAPSTTGIPLLRLLPALTTSGLASNPNGENRASRTQAKSQQISNLNFSNGELPVPTRNRHSGARFERGAGTGTCSSNLELLISSFPGTLNAVFRRRGESTRDNQTSRNACNSQKTKPRRPVYPRRFSSRRRAIFEQCVRGIVF